MLNTAGTPSTLTFGGIVEGSIRGETSTHSLTQADPNLHHQPSKVWTLDLKYFYLGDFYYKVDHKTKYAYIDSTSPTIVLDWPIYSDFQYFLLGVAPDLICELTVFPYCYSLTHTCDYYWPILSDFALTLQIGKKRYTIPVEGYTASN